MADLEVEKTLREIRERVLADARRRAPAAGPEVAAPAAEGAACAAANGQPGGASEALARMDANLSTTARAWSRLPPLLSYRRGAGARLELWLKRLVKRAAHWFTWEQVNFNSAVHHALGDARASLAAHERALAAQEQTLARLQSEILAALRAEAEADRARVEALQAHVAELRARLAQVEPRFEAVGAQLRQTLAAGLERLVESQRAATSELREEQQAAIRARAEELHDEVRARVDGLLEEQRVCFKQLSLEAGEAAVMHDRARRLLEARLEALEAKQEGGSRE